MSVAKMHLMDQAGLTELVQKLQTNFPRAIRPGPSAPILTDNLFDMDKIYDIYDRIGAT